MASWNSWANLPHFGPVLEGKVTSCQVGFYKSRSTGILAFVHDRQGSTWAFTYRSLLVNVFVRGPQDQCRRIKSRIKNFAWEAVQIWKACKNICNGQSLQKANTKHTFCPYAKSLKNPSVPLPQFALSCTRYPGKSPSPKCQSSETKCLFLLGVLHIAPAIKWLFRASVMTCRSCCSAKM